MRTKTPRKKTGKAERAKATRAKARVKTTRVKATRVKTTKASSSVPPMSKSAFIRSKANLPAPEIVRLYKEQYGLEITRSLVYNVRNSEKSKKGGTSGKAPVAAAIREATATVRGPRGSRRASAGAVASGSSDSAIEHQFRGAVLRMGLDRAATLLEEIKASLEGYLGTPETPPRRRSSRSTASAAAEPSASNPAASIPAVESRDAATA